MRGDGREGTGDVELSGSSFRDIPALQPIPTAKRLAYDCDQAPSKSLIHAKYEGISVSSGTLDAGRGADACDAGLRLASSRNLNRYKLLHLPSESSGDGADGGIGSSAGADASRRANRSA
jgi:hypothetical protein